MLLQLSIGDAHLLKAKLFSPYMDILREQIVNLVRHLFSSLGWHIPYNSPALLAMTLVIKSAIRSD